MDEFFDGREGQDSHDDTEQEPSTEVVSNDPDLAY